MPTFALDITDQVETWMSALQARATQFQNPDQPRDSVWSLETMARHYGSLVGVKCGGRRAPERTRSVDAGGCVNDNDSGWQYRSVAVSGRAASVLEKSFRRRDLCR